MNGSTGYRAVRRCNHSPPRLLDRARRASIMTPRIVAFLQNTWVRDPEKVRAVFERNPQHRSQLIRRLLFRGSLTGRRLRAALGEHCDTIYWEEASPEITGTPSAKVTADTEHIRCVLSAQDPDVVLCFGRIAYCAVEPLWTGALLSAPHPAARGAHVVAALAQMRRELERAPVRQLTMEVAA